jgi:hypothetical protein
VNQTDSLMNEWYRYSFASVAATQVIQAGDLLAYYEPQEIIVPFLIYGFTPWILFFLNLSGVWVSKLLWSICALDQSD